jgi:hypothetical protein
MNNVFELDLTNKIVKIFLNKEETIFTTIDMVDMDKIFSYDNWYLQKGYAATQRRLRNIYIHCLIGGKWYDHKDLNPLNNCRNNLRPATRSQNNANKTILRNNTTSYKGVRRHTKDGYWRAALEHQSKHIHLGYFISKEDAAHAYNENALEIWGEFARLNVLPSNYIPKVKIKSTLTLVK